MLTVTEVSAAIRNRTPVTTPDGPGRAVGYRPISETPNVSVKVQLFGSEVREYAQDRVSTLDPRTVDANGFVVGTGSQPGGFGSRPGVGGLGSSVSDGTRTGVIVGLDTVPDTDGLLLHVVWLSGRVELSEDDPRRSTAYAAAERGDVEIDAVPAEGLIALDAYLPDDEAR